MNCLPAKTTLTAVLFHRYLLRNGFTKAARTFLQRSGFDPIVEIEPDKAAGYRAGYPGVERVNTDAYYHAVLFADLLPWEIAKRGTFDPQRDNQRLGMIQLVERWIRRQALELRLEEQPPEEPLLLSTQTTDEALSLSSTLLPKSISGISEELQRRTAAMTPPFHVVRTLTGYGCHAASYEIKLREGSAFLKVFRPGHDEVLHNELSVLTATANSRFTSELLDAADNWYVTSFLNGAKPVKEIPGMISVKLARRIFYALNEIHEAGFAHMDFNASNVLVRGRKVTVIDFEEIFCFDGNAVPLEESPSIVGEAFFRRGRLPLFPAVPEPPSYQRMGYNLYKRDWYPRTGVPVRVLIQRNPIPSRYERTLFVVKKQGRRLLGKAAARS